MAQDNTSTKTLRKQAPAIEKLRRSAIRTKALLGDRIEPVPFAYVDITDRSWTNRLETNQKKTLPFVIEKCRSGRVDNFANTAAANRSAFQGEFYDDSDLYKVIEGAAYSLMNHPDKELENDLDEIITSISLAQWDDGYLNTYYSLPTKQQGKRWGDLKVKHELYCAGHLIEAAIAYYQATGKTRLLDTAIKFADHINSVFGLSKKRDVPGHEEIELALVKLYRLTTNETFLKLARFFLDERGNDRHRELYGTYSQDHKPVTVQGQAVGHAVRAMYLYCAMADMVAESPGCGYLETLDTLWENVVSKKTYLTGGIGSQHEFESFGEDYELPNKTAYSETCAAIGNIMWNHRMFLLNQDAKYVDVLETVLYNAFNVSTAISGDEFFYVNPLESDGEYLFNKNSATRQPWFDCSCCPTNIVRFMPTIGGYAYAQNQDALFVNLYIASNVTIIISGQTVKLSMKTKYPWEERIFINIDPAVEAKFSIKLRIPGWLQSRPLPGDLYSYLDDDSTKADIFVNGNPIDYRMENGYAVIDRLWNKGDTIEMELPMPIRRVLCHENVLDNRQKVALQRGPIVYCAESVDNKIPVSDVVLPDDAALKAEYREDLLDGINTISGTITDAHHAGRIDPTSESCNFIAIPYYAWAHRGESQMAVWLRRR
jgi:hypothetical protein